MTPIPLLKLLGSNRAPHAVVAVRGSATLTWSDFLARSAGISEAIADHGAQRWALSHTDSYIFASALLALLNAGKTVLLPGNVQSGTVRALENDVDVFIGQFSGVGSDRVVDIDAVPLRRSAFSPAATVSARINLLTSGSTGAPKIISKTIAQLDAEIAAQEQLWGERLADSQILATVSHQHIYGLIFRVLWPLCAGRVFRAETAPYLETLAADAAQQTRCALICSPAHLKRLAPTLSLAPLRERVSAVFSSGGPLSADAANRWRDELGQAPLEIFGSTETGGMAQRVQPAQWSPLPAVQCQIDAEGMLAVKSPFTGTDDFIVTGDRARWVADDCFELRGRSDDIVKLEEKRISLRELDTLLCQHPYVDEACTVLIMGARAQLGAVVVLNQHGRAVLDNAKAKHDLDQALRSHLLQFYERVALPRKWRYVDRLPENAQGKLQRDELLGLFGDVALPGTVVEEKSDQLWIAFDLQKDNPAFAGHFPHLSVLPAVVQIGWAIGYAQKYWYGGADFSGLDQVKFSELVRPVNELRMHIANGARSVKFVCYVKDNIVSRGRIKFGADDDL